MFLTKMHLRSHSLLLALHFYGNTLVPSTCISTNSCLCFVLNVHTGEFQDSSCESAVTKENLMHPEVYMFCVTALSCHTSHNCHTSVDFDNKVTSVTVGNATKAVLIVQSDNMCHTHPFIITVILSLPPEAKLINTIENSAVALRYCMYR